MQSRLMTVESATDRESMRIRTHTLFFEGIPSLSAIRPFTVVDEVQLTQSNQLSGGTDRTRRSETGAYRKDGGRVIWNLEASLGEMVVQER